VKEGITKVKGPELAVEIPAQLAEGRKTAAKIVEGVYGLQNPDEGFISAYGRVWREIRRLQSKGLVSTGILGPEQALQAYTARNHQAGQNRRRRATAAHCPEDRRLRLHIHARNLYVDDGDKQPAVTAGKR
jgi:hypothetical protein